MSPGADYKGLELGRYRPRPQASAEIEAIRYVRGNGQAVFAAFGSRGLCVDEDGILHVQTLEGPLRARPGDFVTRDVRGRLGVEPCESFTKTYEPAN